MAKIEKTTRRKTALAPCPLCGRAPKLTETERGIFGIECRCGIDLHPLLNEISRVSRDYVVEQWNRRTVQK